MFKAYGSGFHITFENGFNVSVQWADGRDGSPRNYANTEKDLGSHGHVVGRTAEVAIWDPAGTWYVLEEGKLTCAGNSPHQVVGWQTPEQVAEIIAAVAAAKY